MRSPWSLALLMIVMAGIGVSGWGGRPVSIAPYVIGGALVLCAALVLVLPRRALLVSFAAAAVLVATGAAGYAGHPELALPFPPILSIVIGLYLVLRAVVAQVQAKKPRASDVDE